jgi:hypothetical protein
MDWSERSVTWSKEDHPAVMPTPGGYAMVLDPMFISDSCSAKFTRVLIDGGSSINILYVDTMRKLGIREQDLSPTSTVFHGIVPGLSCSPLGKIKLGVIFGTKEHFRREPIWFEVVNLSSPYHALLGRPALAKFMAIPHYAYLKLKMPGPRGIITITGDYRRSAECASAGSRLAESLVIAEEKRQILRFVHMAQADLTVPAAQQPAAETQFKPAQDIKKIRLNESDPSKVVSIGADLDSI